MEVPADELFVTVDKAKLFCRTYGKDNSPVIVLHGGPGLGQNYLLPQMAELGKFTSAVFYDQRGAGRSACDNDWQANPFQIYIQDIDQLRKAFNFERVSLLSHSWGGILASFYALKYPENVDKIIYLNPVPVSSESYLEFVKHRSQIVNANKDELNIIRESLAFLKGDPKMVERYYRIYFQNYFFNPELASQLSLIMSPEAAINNFKIYEFFYNYVMNNSFDLYSDLTMLNKKSLIIACDKDVIPLHYMNRLHEKIPASELVLINECGHFPYIDQPEFLFKTLRNFMENP